MIKAIYFLKRKLGMDLGAFRDYWLGRHAQLVCKVPGVRSYVHASAEIHARAAGRPIPPAFRREQRSSVDVLGLTIDDWLAQRRVVAGTASECVDVLASLQSDLGLTYVAANVCLTGLAPAEVRRSMERLAAEVVPHFQPAGLPAAIQRA